MIEITILELTIWTAGVFSLGLIFGAQIMKWLIGIGMQSLREKGRLKITFDGKSGPDKSA